VALGFAVYLRLAQTRAVNSDGAAQALQAWDMLHGNLLLHHWTTSDVSFYTTEVPEYLLIEVLRGLGQDVVHIAAALTYTLVVLLAALLAAGRRAFPVTGGPRREALVRAGIAAGIMLAPQLDSGTNVLLSSPDHIGTSVPLLAAWLILDRAQPRWYVPAVVSALLAWAQIADSLVLIAGVVPLAAVCAFRLARPPGGTAKAAEGTARWYVAAVGGGALLSAGVAELAFRLLSAAGGFTVRPLGTQLAPAGEIFGHNLPVAGQCLLLLAGANFSGLPGGAGFAVAALHLAGALLATVAVALALWRFRRLDFVSQVLAAAIAVSVAAFAVTNRVYGVSSAREIAPVLPFAAVLAGRLLAGPLLRRAPGARLAGTRKQAGTARQGGTARQATIAALATTGARGATAGHSFNDGLAPTVTRVWALRRALLPGLCLIGAGYLAGLGIELTTPAAPPQAAQLTAWLERHPLGTGLSGYWESSVVTLTSGGRVAVRPVIVTGGRVTPAPGEVRDDWFDPASLAAHFVVLFPGIAGYPGFANRQAVIATFGRPDRTYHVGEYTLWYWPGNLLSAVSQPGG
jgi:hypothetical protein